MSLILNNKFNNLLNYLYIIKYNNLNNNLNLIDGRKS